MPSLSKHNYSRFSLRLQHFDVVAVYLRELKSADKERFSEFTNIEVEG